MGRSGACPGAFRGECQEAARPEGEWDQEGRREDERSTLLRVVERPSAHRMTLREGVRREEGHPGVARPVGEHQEAALQGEDLAEGTAKATFLGEGCRWGAWGEAVSGGGRAVKVGVSSEVG